MYRGSKKVMLTYIIIALNIIVYAYTAMLSGDFIEIDHHVVRQYG